MLFLKKLFRKRYKRPKEWCEIVRYHNHVKFYIDNSLPDGLIKYLDTSGEYDCTNSQYQSARVPVAERLACLDEVSSIREDFIGYACNIDDFYKIERNMAVFLEGNIPLDV